MKIAIPGGSGQVGTVLARALHGAGHDVVTLSRSPQPAPWRTALYDPGDPHGLAREIDGARVLINLVGRSVNCRYTRRNRREILASRVESVQALTEALRRTRRPPAVWLQASTATIYAHTFGPAHDEAGGILGGAEPGAPAAWRFSIDVASAWERALDEASVGSTRKVKLRSAMIMNPDPGSIFDTLLTLVRRGLGGTSAHGRQYISWIHESDFVRAVEFLIQREDLEGAVNVAAPHPLPNREFMAILRRAWGTRIGLPASRWMLEIGAFLMRSETELILKSRRVIPGRLLEAGFTFQHPDWSGAARDLCARVRNRPRRAG